MRKANFTMGDNSPTWVTFNPYDTIGDHPKSFTSRDLFPNEILLDTNGDCIKVVDFGGASFFGKDSFSYMHIKLRLLKRKQENPNQFYITIETHNPECINHRTEENPEGSKYGGVRFGGWYDSIEETIKSFPEEHLLKSTGSMYWNKTLKITSIKKTNLETGMSKEIEVLSNHNQILNSL